MSDTTSIQGIVELLGKTDHSGTAVSIEVQSVVPGLELVTLFLILACFSIFLVHRKKSLTASFTFLTGILIVAVIAVADLSVITPADGSYELNNPGGTPFNAGHYTISFVHEGYYPQEIMVEVMDNGDPTLSVPLVVLEPLPPGSLLWAKQAGFFGEKAGNSVAVNVSDSSSYVVGQFDGKVLFGANEPNETLLSASGQHDIFVARYTADGTLEWVKQAGGLQYEDVDASGVSVNPSDGTALVGGYFEGDAIFGAGEPNETTLSSSGSFDIFVTKYNSDGTLAWAKRAGGTSGCYCYGVSVNLSDGTTVVTGHFLDDATFGAGEPNETTLYDGGVFVAKYTTDGTLAWAIKSSGDRAYGTSVNLSDGTVIVTGWIKNSFYSEDFFITKYTADGSLIWSKRAVGYDDTFEIIGRGISVNPSDGSALVIGDYTYGATFGLGEPNETTLSSSSDCNVFVAKYNADGTLSWAKKIANGYGGNAIWVNPSDGAALVTGSFESNATFGVGEPNETTLFSSGYNDVFLAKYNSDGSVAWAKRAGGPEVEKGYGISVNPSDETAVVTGSFGNNVTFGPGEPNETTLSQGILAKYSANGTLEWVKKVRSGGIDHSHSVSTTITDGSSLITGYFDGDALFGAGEPNETILSSSGFKDVFVAKYNADGTLAWSKKAGGANSDHGYGISVNSVDGTALVTGFFINSATFGLGEPNETTLNSSGDNTDVFVAKYNADGTLAWAKRAGGSAGESGNEICVNPSDGTSVVIGKFEGDIIFGPGEPGETTLSSSGELDLFVAKYTAEGTLIWAKRAGGPQNDVAVKVCVNPSNGTVLVIGEFESLATFGAGEPGETILSSNGSTDIFLAKYTADGMLAWAKKAGGSHVDNGYGVSVSPFSENTFITGRFRGDATFGTGEMNETTLSSFGLGDIFVAKYTVDGTLIWAKKAGSPEGDSGRGISVSPSNGTALVSGFVQADATFGAGEPNETTLPSRCIFVANYNGDGTLIWVKQAGTIRSNTGASADLSVNQIEGTFFITGHFWGDATFGLGQINETTLSASKYTYTNDLFIAKFTM